MLSGLRMDIGDDALNAVLHAANPMPVVAFAPIVNMFGLNDARTDNVCIHDHNKIVGPDTLTQALAWAGRSGIFFFWLRVTFLMCTYWTVLSAHSLLPLLPWTECTLVWKRSQLMQLQRLGLRIQSWAAVVVAEVENRSTSEDATSGAL